MNINEMQSDDCVRKLIEDTKLLIARDGIDRKSLRTILEGLISVAHRVDLWSEVKYPPPNQDENHVRYLIHEEPDHTFALYLNFMRPGRVVPPHNHTTWACVAAVSGEEYNHLYRRTDGSMSAGHATLEKLGTVVVRGDEGVALLPDDIHSVEIKGKETIRHLHMYGKALEILSERLVFDTENSKCTIMDIGAATRRAPAVTQ
jgi:predicted metal-dependent enzyme (double-stranded beta helix superfamily)